MSRRIIPTILDKRQGFSEAGTQPSSWSLMVGLSAVTVHVGVSLTAWMCHNKCALRFKFPWKLTCLPSWTQLVLTGFCHVLCLCYSFKGCAMPLPSCFSWKCVCVCVCAHTRMHIRTMRGAQGATWTLGCILVELGRGQLHVHLESLNPLCDPEQVTSLLEVSVFSFVRQKHSAESLPVFNGTVNVFKSLRYRCWRRGEGQISQNTYL